MKKKILIGIGGLLAVALLAGAAFMAVRLLNSKTADGPGGLLAGLGLPGGGTASFAMKIEMTPAPELPTTRADVVGQVANIKDNSIFVSEFAKGRGGEGGTMVIVGKTISGGTGASTDSSGPSSVDSGPTPTPGPLTEVVVSKETRIYRDTSMDNVPKPTGGDTNLSIQQVVEPVDISQIAQDYMVQVWGQKRGDRLIAGTILVMGAAVIQVQGGGGK
jgi:hypothetical protein